MSKGNLVPPPLIKPVVYLAETSRYNRCRPAVVRAPARNPGEAATSGIPAGSVVTLAEPENREWK